MSAGVEGDTREAREAREARAIVRLAAGRGADADAGLAGLDARSLASIEAAVHALEVDDDARGAVLVLEGGWNLEALARVRTAADGEALARALQGAGRALAQATKPIVAALIGAVGGPAFELALACSARVAAGSASVALDALSLGLVPSGAAFERLGARVGLEEALGWALDARARSAREAFAARVVDAIAPRGRDGANDANDAIDAIDEARRRALVLAIQPRGGSETPPRGARLLGVRLRELARLRNPLGRRRTLGRARAAVLTRTRGHEPSPLAALDVVEALAARGLAAADDVAARAFGALVVTEAARGRLAHAQDLAWISRAAQVARVAEAPTEAAAPTVRIGIAGGAGLTGAALVVAEGLARAGLAIVVVDPDAAALGRAFTTHMAGARSANSAALGARARITASTHAAALEACDVVLALSDDVEAPSLGTRARARTLALVPWAPGDVTVALLPNAQSPAVVEIVHEPGALERPCISTEPRSLAGLAATGLARALSAIAIPTGGFALRVRGALLAEVMRLTDEGVAPAAIDDALLDWGWAASPTATLATMGGELGWPNVERLLGRVTIGTRGDAHVAPEELQMRTTLAFVTEAIRALDDGALRDVRDGDVLAVRGLGFPAFRGGPFRYVDAIGADEIARRLGSYEARFGTRFAEPVGLGRGRATKRPFHG